MKPPRVPEQPVAVLSEAEIKSLLDACLRKKRVIPSLRASSSDRNQFSFRHSCLTRPLNDSIKALSVGLPGLVKSTPARSSEPTGPAPST